MLRSLWRVGRAVEIYAALRREPPAVVLWQNRSSNGGIPMSIQVLLDAPKTPAREAAIQSIQLATKGDGAAWLELFAEDAVVQDPYGPSPMDPSGEGHRGKAKIKARIRDLKAHRAKIFEATPGERDRTELKRVRREIHRLKHKLRAAAT